MNRLFHVLAVLCVAATASAAELPPRVRDARVLHIAVNAIYPPMEFKDPVTGRLQGVDVDLGEALAKKLGVTLDWQESAFEQLIPSLQTGRVDLILSGLTDRPARRATLDFVDYMRSGPQFYVADTSEVRTPADLCGRRVGTSRSTSFPDEIRAWSAAHCEAAGKPAIEVVPAESTADARAQLRQGRIDGAVQGNETLPYVISQEPGRYRILGEPLSAVFQGIAFAKTDTALREAVAEALAALVADGTYGAIMTRWGLGALTVDRPMLNGEVRG